MDRMRRLIHEIHRRSLWQVLGIYAVAGWAALEAVSGIAATAGLPPWLPSLALVLLVIGLPVVLATAFVQEGTAARAAGPLEEGRPRPPAAGASGILTWRNALLGGVAALGLWGVLAAGLVITGRGLSRGGAAEVAPEAVMRPTGIAVLPFEARSDSGETVAFFASGLHDDLLTQLARVPGLTVISRTSVARYAEDPPPIPQIGRELGVAYILEGGVQQVGQRIRLNAQLIDARTDEHRWAETFDRDLSVAGIFALQAELAERISTEMQSTLGHALPGDFGEVPTQSMAAWQALAEARELEGRQQDREGALVMLQRAVELDPAFAEAWAALSVFHSAAYWGGATSADEALLALDRTLELAPDAAETLWAQGTYSYYVQVAYPLALKHLDRASDLAPGNSEILLRRAYVLRRLGRLEEAATTLARASELDPVNAALRTDLAQTYGVLGDSAAMRREMRAALGLHGDPILIRALGMVLAHGDVELAAELLAAFPPELRDEPMHRYGAWHLEYLRSGRQPSTTELLATLRALEWEDPDRESLWPGAGILLHTVPPWAGEDLLLYLRDGLAARLARNLGAQSAVISRMELAQVLALLGRHEEAKREAGRVVAWVRRTEDRLIGGDLLVGVAVAYAAAGDMARARGLFREGLEQGGLVMARVRLDPAFERLRSDPELRALVQGEP